MSPAASPATGEGCQDAPEATAGPRVVSANACGALFTSTLRLVAKLLEDVRAHSSTMAVPLTRPQGLPRASKLHHDPLLLYRIPVTWNSGLNPPPPPLPWWGLWQHVPPSPYCRDPHLPSAQAPAPLNHTLQVLCTNTVPKSAGSHSVSFCFF